MTRHFTADEDAELIRLWEKGLFVADIQKHFRVGQEALDRARKRLGLPSRFTAFWTPEREAEAKRLYIEQGLSAGEAARRIGAASRNAIIGIAHRRGWMVNGRKPASRPAKAPRAPKAPPVRSGPASPRGAKRSPPKQGPHLKPGAVFGPVATLDPIEAKKRSDAFAAAGKKLVDAFAAPANDDAILLTERRFGQCSWPVGEPDRPSNQMCCGQPVPAEPAKGVGTYCEQHAMIAMSRARLNGKPDAKAYERSLRRFA